MRASTTRSKAIGVVFVLIGLGLAAMVWSETFGYAGAPRAFGEAVMVWIQALAIPISVVLIGIWRYLAA